MSSIINADTTNGVVITSDTSGEIKLQSAGADKVTITSAGNVGIGTSSPARQFHLANTGTGTNTLLSLTSSTTDACQVLFGDTDSDTKGRVLYNNDGDYMRFDANGAERMRIDSSGNLLFNSGYGSVATAYGCRAWVNFNGTGAVAIRSSGNVSSITDNGTGLYTVNFSTAMPNVNYCTIGSSIGSTTSADGMIVSGTAGGAALTTGAVQVRMAYAPTNGATDITHVNVSVFR